MEKAESFRTAMSRWQAATARHSAVECEGESSRLLERPSSSEVTYGAYDASDTASANYGRSEGSDLTKRTVLS